MNINIPPDSEEWLFSDPGDNDGGVWSFRWPPPCEIGHTIIFRFNKVPVARAIVHDILQPGDHDGPCHNGRRYLSGHKVVWLWKDFVDIRGNVKVAEMIKRMEKERGSRRQLTTDNPQLTTTK